MTEWIVRRHQEHVEEYGFDYDWRNGVGGLSFPCDKEGNIKRNELKPEALENLAKCEDGRHDVVCKGVVDYSYNYTVSAQIRCACGDTVTLELGFANGCLCGREYNGCGQLLAPPNQWEEQMDPEEGVFDEDALENCYSF